MDDCQVSWDLLALLLAIAGCGAPGKLTTPSGRPEVFLPDATPEEASALCVAHLQNERYTIEDVTPYRVLGSTTNLKDIGSGSAAALSLSHGNVNARARLAFTIVRSGEGCIIYGSLYHVAGGSHSTESARTWGSGPPGERSLECMRHDHFERLELRLEAIRDRFIRARGSLQARHPGSGDGVSGAPPAAGDQKIGRLLAPGTRARLGAFVDT